MLINFFEYTDNGGRPKNEDALKVISTQDNFIACIADGVGGALGGEVASVKAIEFFIEKYYLDRATLQESIIYAHTKIIELQKVEDNVKYMATTLTCCHIMNDFLYGVHVGDSRVCVLRGNGIKQLTTDHTEVSRLYRQGLLSKEELLGYPRKNILESALGVNREISIQEFSFPLEAKDRILLTTDGVHNVISKVEFRDLNKQNSDLEIFGKEIVAMLEERTPDDNTSFILVEIL